jgi:hypothetical protein
MQMELSSLTNLPTTRKGHGWCMPKTIRRFGEKLLAQQLWCWGRDIECVDENLLLRFGFERHRDRETEDRSTCYRLDHERVHVSLWGFGMFFGCRELGGLFLDRFGFSPVWAPIESLSLAIHWPDELPIFARPCGQKQWQDARELWGSMLLWIADYEKWVRDFAGILYRRSCVQSWLRPLVPADQIVSAWQFLGRRGWEQKTRTLQQALKPYTFSAARP